MASVTHKQFEYLQYIERYIALRRYAPSQREIAIAMRCHLRAVQCHLNALADAGVLQTSDRKRGRSLHVLIPSESVTVVKNERAAIGVVIDGVSYSNVASAARAVGLIPRTVQARIRRGCPHDVAFELAGHAVTVATRGV